MKTSRTPGFGLRIDDGNAFICGRCEAARGGGVVGACNIKTASIANI